MGIEDGKATNVLGSDLIVELEIIQIEKRITKALEENKILAHYKIAKIIKNIAKQCKKNQYSTIHLKSLSEILAKVYLASLVVSDITEFKEVPRPGTDMRSLEQKQEDLKGLITHALETLNSFTSKTYSLQLEEIVQINKELDQTLTALKRY